jgi:hypothetical protein
MSSRARLELAELLGEAFGPDGASRDDVLTCARSRSHPAVVEMLGRLPDRKYTTMRELWNELLKLPIGEES